MIITAAPIDNQSCICTAQTNNILVDCRRQSAVSQNVEQNVKHVIFVFNSDSMAVIWAFGSQVFVTAENGSLFGIIEKKNLIDFDKAKKK